MNTHLRDQFASALRTHRLTWITNAARPCCSCGYVPASSLHMEDHRADVLIKITSRAMVDELFRLADDMSDGCQDGLYDRAEEIDRAYAHEIASNGKPR